MTLLILLVVIRFIYNAIDEAVTPPLPPIRDTTHHLQAISRLPSEKARQQYLMNLRKAGMTK